MISVQIYAQYNIEQLDSNEKRGERILKNRLFYQTKLMLN